MIKTDDFFMHQSRRWLAALPLLTLFALTTPGAQADQSADASAHILQAEIALQREDYLAAIVAYRKAAELSDDPEIASKAAVMGLAYGFNDEAVKAAKRWLKIDDNSDEARLVLGQAYFRLGDLRDARRQYSYLIEKSGRPPGEQLVMLVRYLSDEEDLELGDELMRSLAKPYPDSAEAQYAVASMALRAGDAPFAMDRARRAVELDPGYLKAQLLYGRAMLVNGEPDAAIEYTAGIIGDDPDPDPDARMELAIMYLMTGRDDDALSQVNQVLLEQAGRTDALRLMAIINFRQGYLDAAWDDFQDLLGTGDYDMDALYYLARIADYRGETDRAIRLYSEVRYGSNAAISQGRAAALIAFEEDDSEGALQHLDQFAQASPSHAVDMLLAKAQLLASLDRDDESLDAYDKFIDYRPDSVTGVLGRAELLLQMGRLGDALNAYAGAVKRWPDNALTLNAYGYTLADRTDQFRKAEKLIRKALQYEPDNAAIIDSLGWVLFKQGDYDAALSELQRAYEGLEDPEVAAHIIETLVAMGRTDEALETLLAAEVQFPDSELLADVRTRLFTTP